MSVDSRSAYPAWMYYPANARPPSWALEFLAVVAEARPFIDSAAAETLTSDAVLEQLRAGLQGLGYSVETGRSQEGRIRRPVLYGPQGVERVRYDVDAFHEEHGIALEVEAGRGAMSNAIYRDLVRTSLLVDARYLILGVMLSYHFTKRGRAASASSYQAASGLLDAIYASGRLKLPFEGVLLFGY